MRIALILILFLIVMIPKEAYAEDIVFAFLIGE